MATIRRSLLLALVLSLSLVVAACDGMIDEDDDEADDADTEPTVEEPADSEDDEEDTAATEPESDEEDAEEATPDDAGADETEEATPDEATDDEDATPEDEDDAETTPETDDDATPESDETDGDQADAEEILENAAERAEELETARFELTGTGVIELQELEDLGEISLQEAEGAVERPDRAQIDINVETDAAEVPLSIVSIDGDIYFTDVFTGEWQEAPDEFQYDPAVIFDDEQGIPALIRTVEDAEVMGTEEIDGREAHQVYGQLDQDTIEAGTSGVFQPEEDVDFNVWIDQETSDVLQVRAEDPTEESDSVWEMRIFDHGESVDIEDPGSDDS